MLQTERGPVQLAREGDGSPVLAIHGGPGGFDQGLAWCRHLRDRECEILAPSRPGYLRTPLQSGTSPDGQADLYSAALDALDAAVLLPYRPPINALQRATFESRFLIWLSCQLVTRRPKLMTGLMLDGLATGLTKEQKRAAAAWITSDPTRLRSLQEQATSVAPKSHRTRGWVNDQANERHLPALPFDDVAAPTLIAQGTNDAVVPCDHATNAASKIPGADLVLVEGGHHLLSLSREYGSVAHRHLELALR